MIHVGRVSEIVQYPVKSMAGIASDSAVLGWHGLEADRRFAFRRVGEESGMPWLTAGRLPQLVLYRPEGIEPTHVRTPAGASVALRGPELRAELAERFGRDVELMKLNRGIFDDGDVSVIAQATISGIAREAGVDPDRRRFRANIVIETESGEPFLEDAWLGQTLLFGDADPQPAVSVTVRDERCMMLNLHPDTAEQNPSVMKTVVRLNGNNAGVYATVIRTGTIRVGDRVHLQSQ